MGEKHLHGRGFVNMDPAYHIPALAPPAGITSNFTDPESQASIVSVSCILCLVLIIALSSLRFYTNLWVKKSFKADYSMYSNENKAADDC